MVKNSDESILSCRTSSLIKFSSYDNCVQSGVKEWSGEIQASGGLGKPVCAVGEITERTGRLT